MQRLSHHDGRRLGSRWCGWGAVIACAFLAAPGTVRSAGDAALERELARIKAVIQKGPYAPTWSSLEGHRIPEWFRDAKFGIYTHWGPVTVGAEDGPSGVQWYGKNMYDPKSPTFKYHRERFGDQNKFGYKDIIPLFKAENFDPEEWADLFARSGARFAGPVAVHHDNFAMWDSKVTPWNSVRMGPHRDVVGELSKALRARGLKVITTFHHGFAWRYFEPSFKYDGADPRYAQLYTEAHEPGAPPTKLFLDRWLAMVSEVLHQYEPDLTWFDFELEAVITPEYQQKMFALTYNWAAQHGRGIAVAHKHRSIHRHTGLLDFERGREDRLVPYPWLTDTSVGPWFHQKSVPFKTADQLIDVLVDIVSKNGCMLLNVGPTADGRIPAKGRELLLAIGDWLRVNGEAIFETRPWLRFGEGPTRQMKAGGFSERADRPYTPQDIRFTTRGETLYAIALGWPEDGRLVIRSLAKAAGPVTSVSLVGHDGVIGWNQTEAGLEVKLPAKRPTEHALALKIRGKGLKPAPVPEPDLSIQPNARGTLELDPNRATIHGHKLRVEEKHTHFYLAAWDNPADYATWTVKVPERKTYEVNVVCSSLHGASEFVVEVAGRKLRGTAPKTGDWYDYRTVAVGRVELPPNEPVEVTIRAADPNRWHPINVRAIQLDDVTQ